MPSAQPPRQRYAAARRVRYALLAAGTVALGLASRRFGADLPVWVAQYAGDGLWALLVFWLLAWCRPRRASREVAAWAFGVAVAVEVSQLCRAPWLEAVRHTSWGVLVLGRGFLWSDIACYAAGVLVGYALEQGLRRGGRGRPG